MKVIEVVKKIVQKPEHIQEVHPGAEEYYFCYAGHKFSILQRPEVHAEFGIYTFFAYPKWEGSLEDLDHGLRFSQIETAVVPFHGPSLGPDGNAVLRDLYEVVADKFTNLKSVFADVLRL